MAWSSGSWNSALVSSFIFTLLAMGILYFVAGEQVSRILMFGMVLLPFMTVAVKGIMYIYFIRRIRYLTQAVSSLILKKNKSGGRAKVSRNDVDILEQRIHMLIGEKTEEIKKLKELEEYRRQFLGNVAHELRTPIFSIQGYVHTLKDGALHDQEVNMRFLEKTAKNVDNLTNLVEDLMTISRIESGNHSLQQSRFDMLALIKEVFESLEWMAKNKSITLEVRPLADKQCWVYADREMIRQVLVNLIANAIKYGKENGRVLAKVFLQQSLVKTDISDDGTGIAPEHLGRIFERFYRVDKSRSKAEGGTGLGLAIVKHFIEAHGERIHVNSSPGIGSTFSFCLPDGP